jgi:hypothetical protein
MLRALLCLTATEMGGPFPIALEAGIDKVPGLRALYN